MPAVDILIPTVDNPQFLTPCIESLAPVLGVDLAKVIIINNGMPKSITPNHPAIKVIDVGHNAGWEGGLKVGLQESKAEFVCFLNDDTFFPVASALWLQTLLQHFADPNCAAVGPSSNHICGLQNIWSKPNLAVFRSSYLIGLCMVLRRSHLDEAGGVDDSLPGGDDIDLSIRLRKLGKHLIVDRNVFVYHHLSTTGRRIRGDDWDSVRHQEAYTKALWERHGLKEWLSTMNNQMRSESAWANLPTEDPEADTVRRHIQGNKIYELGCGDKHTCCNAIGVDIAPRGEPMDGVFNRFSDADIVANVFDELPFKEADCLIARHILEHTHNPLGAAKNWRKSLKHGGRLIVAVPDERRLNSIPLNPQHKAAFTPDSLAELMEAAGYKTVAWEPSGNPISFVGVFEANGC